MLQFPIGFRFPQDAIDILLVAFLVYRILLLIKGTRAFQVLLGLILLALAYAVSRWFDLVTLNWILREFLSSFIILVVVLFQADIRRALAQMGKQRFFGIGADTPTSPDEIEEIVRAAAALAAKKIGAIMVIERATRLRDHVEGGVAVDSRLNREVIQALFQPGSPLHDGAVTIERGKVAFAGCFLPLTARTDLDQNLGTRHRAAVGISEETDAIALVVSEERGTVSVVVNGRITSDLDSQSLRKVLVNLLAVGGNSRRAAKAEPAAEAPP